MFSANNHQYPVDRFIPRRGSQNFDISNYVLKPERNNNADDGNMFNSNNSRYVNLAYRDYKCQEFENILWSTLMDKPKKVLNLSGAKNKTYDKCKLINNMWPVKPRKRYQIHSPVVILDAPGLSDNLTHNLLDWSTCGQLASIHDGLVYIWKSDKVLPDIANSFDKEVEHCIKWNRKGTAFAISMLKGRIAVWNMNYNKITSENRCCLKCHIHCIEWTQDDKYILTGCSNGNFCMWSSNLRRLMLNLHQNDIIKIVVSPNNNFVVTSCLDGYTQIWNWPLMSNFRIILASSARAIAFHPWKESLLAIGDQDGEVTIFNIKSTKAVGYNLLVNSTCDAIAWNNITGELVVSYFLHNAGEHGEGSNSIIVYSDLNTITDKINWHTCRVPYLLWGYGGTQLATAGTAEDLCIWNFIDLARKKKKCSTLQESFKIR